jgi:MoaA/NifB/PqqE/SkfB family radical SAM enzyme
MLMKIEIADKSLMMILLLEECNLDCAHCIREDEPMEPGYRLSLEQFRQCLADCRRLESIRWVHFTGGEPTLWAEEGSDLVDLLLEIAEAGYIPGFTSNGVFFEDYDKCRDFFARYFAGSDMPLRLYFSIDTFHGNFDRKRKRASSLDNILNCRQELAPAKADQLVITAMPTISKLAKSLLPEEMVEHYESQGIRFAFVPLIPMGKGRSFAHLCPDLTRDRPEGLGAFYRYYHNGKWEKLSEAERRQRADHINLIGDTYYFAEPWRKVGRLGDLPDEIVRAYAES